MKAVGYVRPLPIEEEESLMDVVMARPNPEGKDVLVRVEAVSVNPVDTKIRKNQHPQGDTPTILGFDVAGVVEEVGNDVNYLKPGDAVYYAGDNSRQGGNSEYHIVDERIVGRMPTTLNYAASAAIPLTGLTAWEALFDRAGLKEEENGNEGKTILIIGAAGGVGSMATQLARFAGLHVIGTASREDTEQWAKENGAHSTINHHDELLPQLEELGIDKLDIVFAANDLQPHWEDLLHIMAPQGNIVSIVPFASAVNLNPVFSKAVRFSWESMFARPRFQTDDIERQRDILNKISGLLDAGILKTTVSEVLQPINAETLRQAHKAVETGNMIGKIVVESFE